MRCEIWVEIQLSGGFRVFIVNCLNGLCSFHVQPAFLPPHLRISILKLERVFKNSHICHVISLLKLFCGSYCFHIKSTVLSSAYRAVCELPSLILQSYLLTVVFTFYDSRQEEPIILFLL